jgi:hypothetical protein
MKTSLINEVMEIEVEIEMRNYKKNAKVFHLNNEKYPNRLVIYPRLAILKLGSDWCLMAMEFHGHAFIITDASRCAH